MNNNICCKGIHHANYKHRIPSIILSKILLTMKLTVLLTVFTCLQIKASVYSQQVSLSVKKAPLEKIIKEIRKQTGYAFFYDAAYLQNAEPVSLDVRKVSLSEALTKVFERQKFTWEVMDKTIVIKPSMKENKGVADFVQSTTDIKGKVVNERGEPLPGATINIKGTTISTAADGNGDFFLKAVDSQATIVISHTGFKTQEIVVGNRKELNIHLFYAQRDLDEVVVVGYGTQKKTDVTGAISSVNFEEQRDRPYTNALQSIQATVPGVNITQTQGAPGASPNVRIRGISSITAGTNPLYVIDGIPMESFDLNSINPQDIKSLDILKDASASAIYGSRGANGVVLITTRLGAIGKTKVQVGYEHGVQSVKRRVKLMNAQEFIKYYIDARNNAWIANAGNADDPNSVRESKYRIPEEFLNDPQQFGQGTDWQDVLFRTAQSDNLQLSLSGGNDKTQFLVSGSYLNQDGVVDNNNYKRLTFRTNLRHKISEKITTGINLNISAIYDRSYGTGGKEDVVSLALQNDPVFPVYNENGNYGFRDPQSVWYKYTQYDLQLWHPYAITREIDRLQKNFNTMATAYLEYEIIQGLKFRTSINANLYNGRYNDFRNAGQNYGWSAIQPAEGSTNSRFNLNWLSENTLSYKFNIGNDNNLDLIAGYTVQEERNEYSQVISGDFPNDLVHTLNAGKVISGTSTAYEWALLSYFGRVNYNYKQKYFLTGSIRRDGSSRFGMNNKWGYFPSIAGSWLISNEDFLQNRDWIQQLKLRASYGVTGNNQIDNYGAISLMSNRNYVNGSTLANGVIVNTMTNPDLRWEKSEQLNVGLDMLFFDQRIGLTLDLYNSVTKDLLLGIPVPDITGFATQLSNIGKMRNRGIEVALTTKNLTNNLKWTTDFNIAVNRNKVLELGSNGDPIYTNDYGTTKTEIGRPIANYYGYVFNGVYNTQEQIESSPHTANTTPGDPIVVDINKDGVINENDRTIIGNYQPDFTAGLTNTFSYKGFEFSFMLQGVFGNEILNQEARFTKIYNGSRNAYSSVNNYWKSPENPGDGKIFKPSIAYSGLQQQFSNYWVEDGTFVRIKNISLSYAPSAAFLDKVRFFKDLRVYVNVENLHVFSNYSGFDPENSSYSTGLMLGADYGSYPIPRNITFGIKTSL